MARKKVIFTEEQLNEIIGGDTTYLDAADKDFREFAGHNEVTVGGKDGLNRQDAEPIIGDKISDAMGRSDNWFTISRAKSFGVPIPIYCSKENEGETINESNSDLEGQRFQVDPTTMRNLACVSGNGKGSGRLKNILRDGSVSYTEATTLKNLLDKADPNGEEYKNMGGKVLHDFINRTLENRTGIIRRGKENMKDLGFENQFQKAGGTKQSGNGQAHTSKIKYFEEKVFDAVLEALTRNNISIK